MKVLKILGVTAGVLIAAIVALFLSVTIYLSTDKGQDTAKGFVEEMLSKKLSTKIAINHIAFHPLKGIFNIYNFAIDDLQGKRMLSVDTLEVSISPMPLLLKEIVLTKAILKGAEATFYKEHPDTAANYQFVLNSLKSPQSSDSEPGFSFTADLEKAIISRTSVKWDVRTSNEEDSTKFSPNHLYIKDFCAEIKTKVYGEVFSNVEITDIRVTEQNSGTTFNQDAIIYSLDPKTTAVKMTLSGLKATYKNKVFKLAKLSLTTDSASLVQKKNIDVRIDKFFFHNDNGKPRKNFNKPHRGAFDEGHMDATVNAQIHINCFSADSISATLSHADAFDEGSHLDVKDITASITHGKEATTVTNLVVKLAETEVKLPSTKIIFNNDSVFFCDTKVSGTTILRDIHLPFAPILKHFTTPLAFRTTVGGPIDNLLFKDIVVNTLDNRLKITAQGHFTDITKPHGYIIDFNNVRMTAKNGIKDVIIGHFGKVAHLKMMRQIRAIGDITFDGKLHIIHKREQFEGLLRSKYVDLKFNFHVNEHTKQLIGNAETESMNLGAIMNIGKMTIGRTVANFNITTSSKAPQSIKAKRAHGRLPVGSLQATVGEAKYSILKVKNLSADIISDGVVAKGNVMSENKFLDINVDFEYKQTDSEQKLTTKPKAKFHGKRDDGKKSQKKK